MTARVTTHELRSDASNQADCISTRRRRTVPKFRSTRLSEEAREPVFSARVTSRLGETRMSKRLFSKKNWYALACMLVLSALFSLQARAQVAGGTLSGSVMDASGATIPAAQISIKNVATGVTRSVT